ncbi:MAG: hypothetical protein ACRESZ_07685 [Methylococcales bacterium]
MEGDRLIVRQPKADYALAIDGETCPIPFLDSSGSARAGNNLYMVEI